MPPRWLLLHHCFRGSLLHDATRAFPRPSAPPHRPRTVTRRVDRSMPTPVHAVAREAPPPKHLFVLSTYLQRRFDHNPLGSSLADPPAAFDKSRRRIITPRPMPFFRIRARSCEFDSSAYSSFGCGCASMPIRAARPSATLGRPSHRKFPPRTFRPRLITVEGKIVSSLAANKLSRLRDVVINVTNIPRQHVVIRGVLVLME